MRCETIQTEYLIPHIDGELEPGETEFLLRHLASCPQCREAGEVFRRNILALKILGIGEPGDLWPGIVEELEGRGVRAAPGRRLRWGLAGRAAALLAAATAALVLVISSRRRVEVRVVEATPSAVVADLSLLGAEAEGGIEDLGVEEEGP